MIRFCRHLGRLLRIWVKGTEVKVWVLLRWPKDGALRWKEVLQRIVEPKVVVREGRRIVVVGWRK
jgi:hypothetical protein